MLLTVITCVEVEEEEKKNYDGFQVLRTFPSTHTQLDTLHSIGQWSQSFIAISTIYTIWLQRRRARAGPQCPGAAAT